MASSRRGRPALREGEPSTSVNVRLPASDYDRVYAQARAERVSVPEVLRRQADQSVGLAERVSALEAVVRIPHDDDEKGMTESFAATLRKHLQLRRLAAF